MLYRIILQNLTLEWKNGEKTDRKNEIKMGKKEGKGRNK